ncbi:MAG: hypothetical protein HZA93_01070 [Verrucomicrobia bacterium]|nr:hypothetical protein [Verrucomicrobiota bacterium]
MLLWPADWLLSSRVELRSFDCFQSLENSPRHRPWWWVPALWIDPLRGFAGAWLLREALGLEFTRWVPVPQMVYVVALSMLALGILCQMLTRRGGRGVLLAPLGFVTGLVLAIVPWSVSLLAIASSALGAFAFRQFSAFFWFGLVAVVLLGLAFEAHGAALGAAGGAFGAPLAIGVVSACALEVPTRHDSPRGPAEPPHR